MSIPGLFGDEQLPAQESTLRPASGAQTQSLYRKYRPQTFESDDLVGQEHIVRTLRNAIQQGRVAHAYLFCGPRGTGKTTTARLLAKAVNCLNPDILKRPCNECASCLAISTGATSDVIEIDAASNRGIDDIRDLRERVKYAPTQLQYKFYIIDEAHQITGAAANAFLKTLEEPPAHTKFVLATTDPEELLATIVSRCQRFDFRRHTIENTVSRLRTVAAAEGLTITDEAVAIVARHATGSMRDALGLLDQLAVYGDHAEPDAADRTITTESVLALLGISRNDRVERLVTALAKQDAGMALSTVNDSVEAGEDPRQLNRQLVAYLRILMHERAGGSPDADEQAKSLARQFDLPALGRLARIFSETDYKIRHSPYAQLPLEIALVEAIVGVSAPVATAAPVQQVQTATASSSKPSDAEILSAPPTTNLRDKLRSGGRGSHLSVVPPAGVDDRPRPVQPPPPEPDPAPRAVRESPLVTSTGDGSISVEQLVDLWPRIRNDVKAVNRRVEALLASIDPIAVTGSQITLAAAYEFHRKRVNEDEVRRVVEETIERIVGRPFSIVCILRGEPMPSPISTGAPAARATMPQPASRPEVREEERAPIDTAIDERDKQRLLAAKNIFDGEEIP